MTKYRLIINRTRCIDCGVSTGQCPTHAKTLSQLLNQNSTGTCIGVFSDDKHDRIKQLAKACFVKAIIIEKIEKLNRSIPNSRVQVCDSQRGVQSSRGMNDYCKAMPAPRRERDE